MNTSFRFQRILILSLPLLTLCSSALAFPINATFRLKGPVPIETLADNVRAAAALGLTMSYQPEDIRSLSGPDENDYNTLVDRLLNNGFEIVGESKTRLWINVRADSGVFEKVFGTHIESLGNGTHRHESAPQIPQDLSLISSISGFDNSHQRRSSLRISLIDGTPMVTHPAAQAAASPSPSSSAPPVVALEPADIQAIYDFSPIYAQGTTGAGQEIAVVALIGYVPDAVTTYFTQLKLTAPTIKTTTVVVPNPAPTPSASGSPDLSPMAETELDIEASGTIAPGATINVYEGENSSEGELKIFQQILEDNQAKIITDSWGLCEQELPNGDAEMLEPVLAQAVAQGVNIFVAAGDNGSNDCGLKNGGLSVDFPASSPYVVAVGGTAISGTSLDTIAETAWSDGGGGLSALFASPSWQSGLPSPYLGHRALPDVSLIAANGPDSEIAYFEFGDVKSWALSGGTSQATPQWAGFLALVNSARVANHKQPLGYLNPIIYEMSAQDKATSFRDIISGSNGQYSAAAGWDAVTGWGSMKAASMATLLENLP